MSAARIPKPKMRGLLQDYVKKTFWIAGVSAVIGGVWWEYFIRQPGLQQRVDILNNTDPDKEYERLKNLGIFQHARPKDESNATYAAFKG